MDSNSIIIAGTGGHAKVVIEIIELLSQYKIAGVVTNDSISSFEGYQVLGNDSVLPELKKKGFKNIAIGVGGFKNNELRKTLYKKYISLGFVIPTIIHPNAYISKKASIGEGVFICAGCSIMTDAKIHNNVLIFANSSVDHESVIEDHVLISAGVTIGAYTTIEEGALIALGAKVISGVTVGQNALVASGAVVINNILKEQKVFGVPAKIRHE